MVVQLLLLAIPLNSTPNAAKIPRLFEFLDRGLAPDTEIYMPSSKPGQNETNDSCNHREKNGIDRSDFVQISASFAI